MILAASGVEPEKNGKEPFVIPFHYAAVASLLQSIRKFTGQKTRISRQSASRFFCYLFCKTDALRLGDNNLDCFLGLRGGLSKRVCYNDIVLGSSGGRSARLVDSGLSDLLSVLCP